MKIRVLSRYGRSGASSRMRFMLYEKHLRRAGVEVEIAPLFDDAYLQALYADRPLKRLAAHGYRLRVAGMRKRGDIDLLWIQSEALPWVPWLFEHALLPNAIPRVVDCDDAIFHRYDNHRSRIARSALGKKVDSSFANAELVTAGNEYLASRAREAGAKRVEIVPTVVDLDHYAVKPTRPNNSRPVFGWIGTPSTWQDYIVPNLDMIREVASSTNSIFRGIGGPDFDEPNMQTAAWAEETEAHSISTLDVGIMPLTDTPFVKGKCGYKLIQFMACGLPVVASPVGVNRDIVEHGVNGFLAETH